jgi:hypothetical protein
MGERADSAIEVTWKTGWRNLVGRSGSIAPRRAGRVNPTRKSSFTSHLVTELSCDE